MRGHDRLGAPIVHCHGELSPETEAAVCEIVGILERLSPADLRRWLDAPREGRRRPRIRLADDGSVYLAPRETAP